ncbi:MAG: hypothetical protein H6644_17330 [Caldilineaceae bacterium]|nr:hypothetical protein [Caldilineaceae bacterium]
MGGTTFDVALIAGGRSFGTEQRAHQPAPVLQPTIDIVSIGRRRQHRLDRRGRAAHRPAERKPCPVPPAHGLGGTDATVTDAQVLLSYLDRQLPEQAHGAGRADRGCASSARK